MALTLWLMMPSGAAAQTTLPLSLEDAIQRGVGHDPRLAEGRSREIAASTEVTSKTTLGRPTVTTSASYLRTNHVPPYGVPGPGGTFNVIFPDVPNNYRVRAEVDVPLYTSGRVDSQVDVARANERASVEDLRASEQDVRLDIARAYWGLVTARENARVLQQALDREDAWVADVKARVDAGVLPPNDLLSAQAQRARESVGLIQAKNDAAVAQIALGLLIGVGPDSAIEPTTRVNESLAGVSALESQTAVALAASAREQRGERLGLQARQAGFAAGATAALSTTKPIIAALGGVQPARPNERFVPRKDQWDLSWDLGVNLTWPLWDGGRARADAATATAQAEAVSHRIEQFDARLALEVRQCLLDLASSRAALVASEEGVAAATEAHRVVTERFNAGVATSTDVLDAQLALIQAELDRTRLLAGLRLNEARLLRAMGRL
jgi:outer membrane protein TolC